MYYKINKIQMNKFWIIVGILALISCQQSAVEEATEVQQEGEVKEIKSNIANRDLIRNPKSADENVDPDKIAVFKPLETEFDFGLVNEGEKVEHTFKFVNTGKVPLVVKSAKSTCGCTVPKKPKEPIKPGAEGEIAVTFDSNGRPGEIRKVITIVSNTFPPESKVVLTGKVKPKKK